MYYIALMWLIVLASVLFTAYFKSYSSIGKSQMYADLIADGTAYGSGWLPALGQLMQVITDGCLMKKQLKMLPEY